MSAIRIAVAGAGGRMGQTLIQAVTQTEGLAVSVASEQPGSSLLGADAGELAAVGRLGVEVRPGLGAGARPQFDVLIDFTAPAATMEAFWSSAGAAGGGW